MQRPPERKIGWLEIVKLNYSNPTLIYIRQGYDHILTTRISFWPNGVPQAGHFRWRISKFFWIHRLQNRWKHFTITTWRLIGILYQHTRKDQTRDRPKVMGLTTILTSFGLSRQTRHCKIDLQNLISSWSFCTAASPVSEVISSTLVFKSSNSSSRSLREFLHDNKC